MQKSDWFTVRLLDKFHLFIPSEIVEQFPKEKRSRFKIKFKHQDIRLEVYAALRKDKNTGNYRMMFSKGNQQKLGLHQNDYMYMQLLEDISKYGVEMPEELEEVFKFDLEAFTIFEALTDGKKRSIIYHVKRIKNVQNKVDKSLILCNNLKLGIKDMKLLFKS